LPRRKEAEMQPSTRSRSTCRPVAGTCLAFLLLLAAAIPAQALRAGCGGCREAICTWSIVATGQVVQAQLLGSAVAEVSVTGPTTMSALWVSVRLFGTIPGVGAVEMSAAAAPASVASIVSNSPSGVPFYPAEATQQLFYLIQVLDSHGNVVRQLVNKAVMGMQAEIQQIPPYGTPFPLEGDVSFYDVTNLNGPPVLVLKARGSTGTLSNPGGLKVSLLSDSVNSSGGTYQTQWKIENLTSAALTVNWFATGFHSATITSPSEGRNVVLGAHGGSGSAITVSLAGHFDPGELDSGLAVNAISAPGQPVAEDHSLFYLLQSHSSPRPANAAQPPAGQHRPKHREQRR
jgi:hypothetical protein